MTGDGGLAISSPLDRRCVIVDVDHGTRFRANLDPRMWVHVNYLIYLSVATRYGKRCGLQLVCI